MVWANINVELRCFSICSLFGFPQLRFCLFFKRFEIYRRTKTDLQIQGDKLSKLRKKLGVNRKSRLEQGWRLVNIVSAKAGGKKAERKNQISFLDASPELFRKKGDFEYRIRAVDARGRVVGDSQKVSISASAAASASPSPSATDYSVGFFNSLLMRYPGRCDGIQRCRNTSPHCCGEFYCHG